MLSQARKTSSSARSSNAGGELSIDYLVSEKDVVEEDTQSDSSKNIFQWLKERLAAEKNARYLAYVSAMTPAEVLPGAAAFLRDVRAHGVLTVLGSASKNAGTILDRCGLRPLFDAVVDGTGVTHPKPDPEVFAKGAGAVGVRPENCVVFEDAAAGIEAAARAGMRSVGVGGSPLLAGASMQLKGFEGFTFEMLCREID